jgi:tetratricopeptide (TPR) repeat protein
MENRRPFRSRVEAAARGVAVAGLVGLGFACAGTSRSVRAFGDAGGGPADTPTPLAASSAARAPIAIASDEDADRVRQDLDALPDRDPGRAPRRQALLGYYLTEAQSAIKDGHGEEAFSDFTRALSLVEPGELQEPNRPPPFPQLLPVAQQLDHLFSRRGAHPEVVTAMMVEKALLPRDAELTRRYGELTRWLGGQSDQMPNLLRGRGRSLSALLAEPPSTLASDLEQTYRVWPSALVRAQLLDVYRGESRDHYLGGQRNPKEFLQSLSASVRRKGLVNGPAFKVARLYLRVSRPREAVQEIKQLSRLSGEEGRLLDVLEETLAAPVDKNPDAESSKMLEAVKLALGIAQNPEDADVSLQICRDVARRAPQLAPAELCVGELATALDRKGLALRAFERARTLAPTDRQIWEKLGLLYVERLSDLVSDERTTELQGALAEVEAFYDRMRKQFADSDPGISMALALAEVGRGYYNAGRIEEAQRYLGRSVELHPNAAALELVGIIHLRRGEYAAAAGTLERARAVHLAATQFDPLSKAFFSARVGRQIAEALDQLPDGARAAAETRRQSLRAFDQLLTTARLPPERVAEIEIERGKMYYQGGDREAALGALQRAADVLPTEPEGRGSGQQFVEMVAFLVQRGELEAALEMYHRALSHSHLSESMKVYCSLWINDLLVRAGQVPDPLAVGFLKSVQSGKWPADLARWAVGQLSEADLLAHADTPGHLAEAQFYVAMAHLRAADRAGAEALWRKVLDSNMMGFFEYEMASYFLKRHAAPTEPVLKTDPSRSHAGSSGPARAPAGSI